MPTLNEKRIKTKIKYKISYCIAYCDLTYLNVSFSGLITSVGKERADISAINYS